MAEIFGAAGKRWFQRGQRVRFGVLVGIVQSTFVDGIHYVYLDDEHRLIAVPGNMLTAANELTANGEVGEPEIDQPRV